MIPLRKLKPNYSKEQIEIGTWIDGRKIYRKVYFGKGDVPKEVSVVNCATVIDMRMVVKNKANNGSWRTVPWLYDTADIISLSNLLEDYNQGGGKTASMPIISLLKLLKDYNTIPLFKWYLKNLLPLCFCINQTFVDFFYFST